MLCTKKMASAPSRIPSANKRKAQTATCQFDRAPNPSSLGSLVKHAATYLNEEYECSALSLGSLRSEKLSSKRHGDAFLNPLDPTRERWSLSTTSDSELRHWRIALSSLLFACHAMPRRVRFIIFIPYPSGNCAAWTRVACAVAPPAPRAESRCPLLLQCQENTPKDTRSAPLQKLGVKD